MTRLYLYCCFAALLTCSACSPSGPSTSHDSKATTAVGSSDAAAVPSPPSAEARVVPGVVTPEPEAPAPNMKPEYSDKAEFLASLESTRPKQAVALDGKNVWKGFGPALSYRTNKNGSISH